MLLLCSAVMRLEYNPLRHARGAVLIALNAGALYNNGAKVEL